MFKENNFNEPDELTKAREEASTTEAALNKTVMKKEFLNRVSEKYRNHTKLLTNLKNFNHMLKEIDRINNYYGEMLENLYNPDFDFISYEKEFDSMIAEDMSKIK